jgi:hypothetical protein
MSESHRLAPRPVALLLRPTVADLYLISPPNSHTAHVPPRQQTNKQTPPVALTSHTPRRSAYSPSRDWPARGNQTHFRRCRRTRDRLTGRASQQPPRALIAHLTGRQWRSRCGQLISSCVSALSLSARVPRPQRHIPPGKAWLLGAARRGRANLRETTHCLHQPTAGAAVHQTFISRFRAVRLCAARLRGACSRVIFVLSR